MELGNGWGLSEPLLRKLRLLEYFADNSRGSSIPPLPEWAQQPGSKEHEDAISDLQDFDSRGWLDNFGQDYYGGGATPASSARATPSSRTCVRSARTDSSDTKPCSTLCSPGSTPAT